MGIYKGQICLQTDKDNKSEQYRFVKISKLHENTGNDHIFDT